MHWILHVDVDEFAVSVELLRRPELRGKPVVVAGSGASRRRGVVSSSSPEAREAGVGAGMPLRTAAHRCPEALVLPLDVPAYVDASRRFMRVLRDFGAVRAGGHEAYVAVETADPESLAREIQDVVHEVTGLSCSIGIGENRLQAKIASALAKPTGTFRLTGANWHAVIDDRPTDVLVGVGPGRRRRLAELGIETVGELEQADVLRVRKILGPQLGPRLQRLARGEEGWTAARRRPARSHGRELTFERNVENPRLVRRTVAELAEEVARDLADRRREAERVTVTVRSAGFETHTHTVPVLPPGASATALTQAALHALEWLELDLPVRLVGVRAHLSAPTRTRAEQRQLTLFAA
jgi:DNA polymerase-4